MKHHLPVWAVHSIYLLLIASLAGLVGWDRYFAGDRVLFKSLSTSMDYSPDLMAELDKNLISDIYKSAEAYRIEADIAAFQKAIRLESVCDSTTMPLRSSQFPDAALSQNLRNLFDTLVVYTDSLPELIEYLKEDLLQSEKYSRITQINFAQASQQEMLRNTLITNVQFSKLATLCYLDAKTAGGFTCWDSAPIFRETNVVCPQVGQVFKTTILFSTYAESRNMLHPGQDKVWVNEESVPIKNGAVEFSTIFPSSGLQPLRIRVEKQVFLTDSVQVFEKTYMVHVR